MPVTTFLHDGELNQPINDYELARLLSEARALTGKNYQVVTHKALERCGLFGLRLRTIERTQLYLEVGGMAPWQVLSSAHDVPTIKAYLLGLTNGAALTPPAAAQGGCRETEIDVAGRIMQAMPELQRLLELRQYENDSDAPMAVEVETALIDAVMYEFRDTICRIRADNAPMAATTPAPTQEGK